MINKKKKNPLTILIGRRIAAARKRAGLSQQDVEDKATQNGERLIKYRTLSLIEQGYGEPKITTLYEIARTLDVPLGELLDITQDADLPIQNDIKINEIMQAVKKLKAADLDKVIHFLKLFD